MVMAVVLPCQVANGCCMTHVLTPPTLSCQATVAFTHHTARSAPGGMDGTCAGARDGLIGKGVDELKEPSFT